MSEHLLFPFVFLQSIKPTSITIHAIRTHKLCEYFHPAIIPGLVWHCGKSIVICLFLSVKLLSLVHLPHPYPYPYPSIAVTHPCTEHRVPSTTHIQNETKCKISFFHGGSRLETPLTILCPYVGILIYCPVPELLSFLSFFQLHPHACYSCCFPFDLRHQQRDAGVHPVHLFLESIEYIDNATTIDTSILCPQLESLHSNV